MLEWKRKTIAISHYPKHIPLAIASLFSFTPCGDNDVQKRVFFLWVIIIDPFIYRFFRRKHNSQLSKFQLPSSTFRNGSGRHLRHAASDLKATPPAKVRKRWNRSKAYTFHGQNSAMFCEHPPEATRCSSSSSWGGKQAKCLC